MESFGSNLSREEYFTILLSIVGLYDNQSRLIFSMSCYHLKKILFREFSLDTVPFLPALRKDCSNFTTPLIMLTELQSLNRWKRLPVFFTMLESPRRVMPRRGDNFQQIMAKQLTMRESITTTYYHRPICSPSLFINMTARGETI